MNLSPIALFAYNRPGHFRKTLEALSKNKLASDSILYIFLDGPRNVSDMEKILEIETIIKNFDKTKFASVFLEKSEKNKGLAQSIIDGVTKIIRKAGKVIVLEDDLVTSPYFLEYMNQALEIYEHDKKVFHVSGFFYPHKTELPESFFLHHLSSWGWATWADRWEKYEDDSEKLIKALKEKPDGVKILNLDNTFNFFSTLKANSRKIIRTWAIKWQTVVILNDGLCLFPNKSLVKNIGNDGTGENSKKDISFNIEESDKEVYLERIPIEASQDALKVIKEFFYKIKPSLVKRITSFILFNLKKH